MGQAVNISVVGDIFPSNTTYTVGFGNGSRFLRDNFESWERSIVGAFKEADISFGNLEAALIDNAEIINNSAFAGSAQFANTLKNIGINIVSIANNHILEKGIEGFTSTRKALETFNILYVGLFNNHKSNIALIEKNNLKFGFAAFNSIKDIPNNNLHAELNSENVKRTLDEMCSLNLDYKLLSFHWGNEYIHIPSYEQINFAHDIINYGADVIIGHHPHVIQPVERYKHGIIIYSLGNFLFDYLFSKDFKTGLKVDLKFTKDSKIEYSISEVRLNEISLNTIIKTDFIEKRIETYHEKMNKMYKKSSKEYNKYFIRALKINRSYQRFLMKVMLLKLLFFSNHKQMVFNNIIDFHGFKR